MKQVRFAFCLFAATLGLIAGVLSFPAMAQEKSAALISAADAYKRAVAGELILLDIRTAGEWKQTGVGESAMTLTMHQSANGFFKKLDSITGGDKSTPLALICATGMRSAFLLPHIKRAGYSSVVDVGEGMMGSKHGSGWLKSGLPVEKYDKK